MYIGYLSIENKKWANDIVSDLIESEVTSFKRWLLAARSMLDMHKDRRDEVLLNKIRERLLQIIDAATDPNTRVEAGETLGWLGDPRDLKEFIPVDGGKYKLSLGKITIKPFEIGKYPVTNKWFEEFIKAGGYKNMPFWSEEGKEWLRQSGNEYPSYWNERKWKCPNSPVVGVCWYEAQAFTNWLTATDKDGYKYKLPDENEWEAAAAGFEGREYPWGVGWDKNKCNTDETKIGRTSPVGIFKGGNTLEVISDMSWNVWEWTDSWCDNEKKYKVLRGDSWGLDHVGARGAYRAGLDPGYRNYGIGFRCVRTITL